MEGSLAIYVNSSNRADIVCTHKQFPQDLRGLIHLVIPYDQYSNYRPYLKQGVKILRLSKGFPPFLAPQRQWIYENAHTDHVFIMDDDLQFYYRNEELKMHVANEDHVRKMMEAVATHLKVVEAVGVSPRYQNNLVEESYKDNTRISRCFTVDVRILRKEGFRIDPYYEFMHDDMLLFLQWLQAGYKNRIIYDYAQSDKGSNTPGGCAMYRDDSVQERSANYVKNRFPQFVSIMKKTTKTSWQGFAKNRKGESVRVDLNIHWKKAYRPRQRPEGVTRFF